MEKTRGNCQGIDCPGLNAGPQSLEHERRFVNGLGTGLTAKNSAEKVSDNVSVRNPAK